MCVPVVNMLRDWLKAESVMFWMLVKERDCDQVATLDPDEVQMVDVIEIVRLADRSK